jgi:hypothetical protein
MKSMTDAWDVGEGDGVGVGLPVGWRCTVGNSRWSGIVVDTVGVVVVDIAAAAVDVAAAVPANAVAASIDKVSPLRG